jgi:hypothetical protein
MASSLVMLPKFESGTGDDVVLATLMTQQMRLAMVDTTMVPAPRRRLANNPNSKIKRTVVDDKKEITDMINVQLKQNCP